MNKQIEFQVNDNRQLATKTAEYFTQSGFKLTDTKSDQLKFIHSSSIFDAWKLNPIKWGSEVTISFNRNNVKAEFSVDTEAQMNTSEEENVWETFIENFRAYLTTGIEYKDLNKKALEEVRKTRLIYMGWTILGAAIGGVIGIFFYKFAENNFIGYIAIPIMASFFLNRSINQRKKSSMSL